LTFEPEAFSYIVKLSKITTLVWGFTLGGGIDQIDRNVCCLGVENGGMGMINMQEFIDSNRIKLLYRIVYEPCRNEVNTIDLFLKVIEELQNILGFRMESM
jgi:hypothetical protein